MKNKWMALLLLVLLGVGLVWHFSKKPVQAHSVVVPGKLATLSRLVSDPTYLKLWWPSIKMENKGRISDGDYQFAFGKHVLYQSPLTIFTPTDSLRSSISISPVGSDSCKLVWLYQPPSSLFGSNDIQKALDQHIQTRLQKFESLFTDLKYIYGSSITFTNLADQFLITIIKNGPSFPTTNEIYTQIDRLYSYAAKQKAKATNSPMLHIWEASASGVQFMVALPVDKKLAGEGDIEQKQMLKGGKFLQTDTLVGGMATLQAYFKKFDDYKTDFGLSSPAIPFQSLITDRQKQVDTMQWKTKLYYPVY